MLGARSLRSKLLRNLVPLIIAVGVLSMVVVAVLAYRDGNRRLTAKLAQVGEVEASALAAPLFNYDIDSIERILQALSFDSDVSYSAVLDAHGKMLAEAGAAGRGRWDADLTLERPIQFDVAGVPTKLGEFLVVLNRDKLRAEMARQLLIHMGRLIALLAVLVIGASLVYRRTIDMPLTRLLGSISNAERGAGLEPVDWSSDDEIGTIVDAYNRMLARRITDERALRESQDRFRAIAEATPVPVSISRASDGRILYANPQIEKIVGLPPAELIGRRTLEFYAEASDRDRVLAALKGDGQIRELELEFKDARGQHIRALVLFRDLVFDGSPAILAGIYDISERKRAEQALLVAKTAAELANRTKSEFLANVSHELRTPLNAIMGFAEIMQRQMFGPLGARQYGEYIDDILYSSHHLLDLVNDILDLTKLEAGRMELTEAELDPGEVCRTCLRLVSARAWDGKVRLDSELPPGLPKIRADEIKMKQILLNLLSNAIKFTPPGGTVRLSAALEEGGGLAITVSDTGIGIAPGDLEKALTPFGRVEGAFVRSREGTGLGLPLSKVLIELHGGSLALESVLDRGTVARVVLPKWRIVGAAGGSPAAARDNKPNAL